MECWQPYVPLDQLLASSLVLTEDTAREEKLSRSTRQAIRYIRNQKLRKPGFHQKETWYEKQMTLSGGKEQYDLCDSDLGTSSRSQTSQTRRPYTAKDPRKRNKTPWLNLDVLLDPSLREPPKTSVRTYEPHRFVYKRTRSDRTVCTIKRPREPIPARIVVRSRHRSASPRLTKRRQGSHNRRRSPRDTNRSKSLRHTHRSESLRNAHRSESLRDTNRSESVRDTSQSESPRYSKEKESQRDVNRRKGSSVDSTRRYSGDVSKPDKYTEILHYVDGSNTMGVFDVFEPIYVKSRTAQDVSEYSDIESVGLEIETDRSDVTSQRY